MPTRRRALSASRSRRLTTLGLATAVATLGAVLAAPATGPAAAAHRPTSGDACGSTILKADGTAWRCSFDDEFSGRSIDTSRWVVGTTAATGFSVGPTCMTADNVAVSGGSLKLTTRDTGSTFDCTSAFGSFATSYTGAHVATAGKFDQTYGRFEVRARYPQSGAGLHGGFWMYPTHLTYGAWPASGEIDVAEWWSDAPGLVMPTLHYSGSDIWGDSGWGCQVADATTWHTYTLVWEPTRMQFSIDGTTCFTDSWTPDAPLTAPEPFDQPFGMVLNMAVDNMSGNEVGAATTLPATYQVDYVKAWK